MTRGELMKALWEMAEKLAQSEDETDKRNAKMLEVAGNIVENTHCLGDGEELIFKAIYDEYEYLIQKPKF
jgi:hypothetical protein